jgi:hypothetical protein
MGTWSEQRDAYLRAQVEPEETVLVVGPAGMVTNRRMLFGWPVAGHRRAGEWAHDAVAFDEVTRWSQGQLHDERPLLRLEHPSHRRLEWVPAHRFLWFRWGNAAGEMSHEQTTFSFASRRDPVFHSMKERLEHTPVPRGEPFVEVLPGTREERVGGGVAVFRAETGFRRVLTRLRHQLANLDEQLHHAHIKWWIRAASWLLLAIPAWFVTPKLALPAVVFAEVAWIVGLQWSWHRDRHRRGAQTERGPTGTRG